MKPLGDPTPSNRPMRRIALLSTFALLAVACLGSDFADSVEGSWQLTSGIVDSEEIPLVASHPITINFEGDEISGTASCNGYGGSYELSGSTISFGNLAMTEMACFPDETMTAEAMYGQALMMVDTVSLDEVLTLSGGGAELVFEALPAVPDAELTNTVWVLDGLISGDAVSSVAPERATLEFFTDGSVLGDTGCRPFSGQYIITGAEVTMTELAADGHECEPQLADQDNHVISALEGTFRVEIEESRLTTWTAGDEGLTYIAES